ncbi:MAG: IS1595 family transposase, partial [Cytophagaceae bacterium]|nr:IS1595 family transposase [Cytophagaceae bacterium]MDW8457064.1 IS1595 family transposase [Cytophagaceae bacterium]
MEARFKSLSLFEFQKRFPDEESCLVYLSELKWAKG